MAKKINFTKNQLKAIDHRNGHLRILACAGSGKTEVISQRIARLIQAGVSPKNIVAFTFTEKAADELKSRIRGILDEQCPERADFGDMYVGTIHSFCFFMLQELKPEFKAYEVLDEAKRVAYIAKRRNFSRLNLWSLMKGKTGKNITYYTTVTRFIYSVDIVMMENIRPEKLSNSNFRHAYTEYRTMLEEDKYLDFSSMIHTLVDNLKKDRKMLKKFNERIRYLVVDEYQDVNRLQEELIELIESDAESVCVVGDDDQCIYQWRGSSVDNILDFSKKYSDGADTVVDIPLNTNFRSTEAVIHTAGEFIKKNTKRLSIKNMTHNLELERTFTKGDIMHKHFNTEDEESAFIVDKIREINGAEFIDKRNKKFSLSLGDIAVLVRTNSDAARIIPFFEHEGIDCVAYSGSNVFERSEIQFVMDCIAYLFNCGGYRKWDDNPPLLTDLKANYKKIFDKKKFPQADPDSFEKKLKIVKSYIDKILKKGKKDYLGELGLQAVYHKILNTLGAEEFDFGEVYNYNLAVLSNAVSDYESVWVRLRATEVKDFFSFLSSYGESYVETQHQDASLVNAVKILTIHKSKGLEFPVVFLPGLVDKRSPNPPVSYVDDELYDISRYNGTVEDKRRLFYTAMTRSEKYLFLSGYIKKPNTLKNYSPSRFITELDKKFITPVKPITYPKSKHPPRLNRKAIYPTSFSELTTYDRCPQDFRLRYVLGYKPGVPAAFGYGTNIHNILNVIHNKFIEDGIVPDEKHVEKIFHDLFKLRYATEKMQTNMEKAAKKIVKNYLSLHKGDFKYILETEKRFEFVMDEAIIKGQIDLLKKVDGQGNLSEVEIIDFKTESDKDDKVYKIDHIKQLRFYAIACLNSLGLKPRKAGIHHLDKTRNKKEYVDISPKHLDKTKEQIASDVKNILSKKFPPKPSSICNNCDYRYICPMKKFRLGCK